MSSSWAKTNDIKGWELHLPQDITPPLRGKETCDGTKRGLSNTPKLSPMDEGHVQPDSPEVSSRET